jgi:hypothetical protein
MFGILEDIVAGLCEQPLVIRKMAAIRAAMTKRPRML